MNSITSRPLNAINWSAIIPLALGFWLSGSLLLDLVILPGLYTTGMMTQAGFVSAGYVIFGLFNHIELLCAALVITGYLVLHQQHQLSVREDRWAILLACFLLGIALIYTYFLTPQMSGLGLQLNLFEVPSLPSSMLTMQWTYWGLEVIKLLTGVWLLRWHWPTQK